MWEASLQDMDEEIKGGRDFIITMATMEKAELGNTKLRENIATYIRENYCFCFKDDCPACLLHKCLGSFEVDIL